MYYDENKDIIKKSQKHLEETKENYFEHMGNALKISFQLLISALMAFIHGLFPSIFMTGASSKIKKLYFFVEKRNKN